MTVRHALSRGERVFAEVSGESRTKQSFKDECDINKILARFQRTGAVAHFSKFSPQYGEVPSVDFHEALLLAKKGIEMFEALPSSLRKRFENSPEAFLAFVQDSKNADEMVSLGLIAKPPAAEVKASGGTTAEAKPTQ